jgi:large subunit ribosomal protein L29
VSKTTDALDKLRDLPADELKNALARVRDELFRLQLGRHTNQVTSTAEMTQKRREISKILTILRARDLDLEKQGSRRSSKTGGAAAKEG